MAAGSGEVTRITGGWRPLRAAGSCESRKMATDLRLVVQNLLDFYPFAGKTVVSVGAGGGQLVEYGREARRVVAVDSDVEALRRLADVLGAKGLAERFELVCSDFLDVTARGDVVLFEFSLHEMPDPERALAHARTLAPDVVVLDHAPGSEWAWHVVEEEKVRRSAEAARRAGVRAERLFRGEQRFASQAELLAKVSGQGPLAVERAERFRGASDIVIPFGYEVALL